MSTETELTEKDLELISKSLDEDLSEFERRRLNTTVLSKQDGEKAWTRYHAVSAIMKKQFPKHIDSDFSAQVMQAISDDTSQEYQQDSSTRSNIKRVGSYVKQVTGLAVAASVAAFSIVTYQYFNQPELAGSDSMIVSKKEAAEPIQPAAVALQKSQQVEFAPATQQLNVETKPLTPSIDGNVYYQELNPYIHGHAGYGSQRIISPYVEIIELKDVQE